MKIALLSDSSFSFNSEASPLAGAHFCFNSEEKLEKENFDF